MTRVDSHLHVWRAALTETAGVRTLVPPQTDVPIDDARRVMAEHDIARAVLVQPVFRGEDNSYVADRARAEPDRFAAVCVVDPRVAGAEDRLAYWCSRGCRGLRLRPRIAAEAHNFGDPLTYPLWEAAGRMGIVISILCDPQHAPAIDALAERFPEASIVIDHMGHPDVTAGPADANFKRLLLLARHPRVFIKLSGFYHFSAAPFPFDDCRDLVRAVHDRFGPERLAWGSDFPHVQVTCGYARSLLLPEAALDGWSTAERDVVMGGNALRLYWPAT